MVPRLELGTFRYRDPRTGKRIRGRYRAERHEIAARFAEFEVISEPEIRNCDPDACHINPQTGAGAVHRPVKEPPKNLPRGPKKDPPEGDPPVKEPPTNPPRGPRKDPPEGDPPVKEPPDEDPAALDNLERFLRLVFLRRYVSATRGDAPTWVGLTTFPEPVARP